MSLTEFVISNQKLITAIQKEFRFYGFKAEDPRIEKEKYLVFNSETPTGMAAFSQKEIECGADLNSEKFISLRVSYIHHNLHTNGYSEWYHVIYKKDDLIDLETITDVILIKGSIYQLVEREIIKKGKSK